MLPEDKTFVDNLIKRKSHLIGDGINDAPSLASARWYCNEGWH